MLHQGNKISAVEMDIAEYTNTSSVCLISLFHYFIISLFHVSHRLEKGIIILLRVTDEYIHDRVKKLSTNKA